MGWLRFSNNIILSVRAYVNSEILFWQWAEWFSVCNLMLYQKDKNTDNIMFDHEHEETEKSLKFTEVLCCCCRREDAFAPTFRRRERWIRFFLNFGHLFSFGQFVVRFFHFYSRDQLLPEFFLHVFLFVMQAVVFSILICMMYSRYKYEFNKHKISLLVQFVLIEIYLAVKTAEKVQDVDDLTVNYI